MKVAHVNQDPGVAPDRPKGAAVHVDAIRRALRRRGAEVVAVDEPIEARLERTLRDALDAGPLDLIYERYALARHRAAGFARRHSIPYVLEVNAPLAEEQATYRGSSVGADDELEREQFRLADRVLVVSPTLVDFARERGSHPDRIVVEPNGVDVDRFRPDGRALARASLVPPDSFVIGFHGRLRPWHRFDRIARVTGALVDAGLPLFVLTVGDGPYREALGEHLPPHAFRSLAWVPHDEVGRYVACFDVLPLGYDDSPSFYFCPLKLIEAMAAGVVPIVPDVGGLGEIVRSGTDGLVYRAGDERALEGALRRLLSEPTLCSRLSSAARVRSEQHTWDSIAERLLASVVGVRR